MLDAKALKNLADLARIDVSDEELETLGKELGSILSFVDEISTVEIPQGEAVLSAHRNISRHDDVRPLEPVYDLIDAAPAHQDNFVKVPKVIE